MPADQDPGALAFLTDPMLGELTTPVQVLVLSGLPVDTSAITPPTAPVVITYAVLDPETGETVVSAQRWVHVRDPCAPLEHLCQDSKTCSVRGTCSDPVGYSSFPLVAAVVSSTAAPRTYLLPSPPRVILRAANGDEVPLAVVDTSGATTIGQVMPVEWGTTFMDPGYNIVTNEPEGTNTTDPEAHRVIVCGAELATDTSQVWNSPRIVSYTPVSRDGIVGATVYRLITVVCPPGEVVCSVDDITPSGQPGKRTCSVDGVCGMSSWPNAAAFVQPLVSHRYDVLDAASSPLELQLVGPKVAEVQLGQPYDRCWGSEASGCDPGVLVTGAVSTEAALALQNRVVACSEEAPAAVTRPLPFQLVGLRYCRLNTSSPSGAWKRITFSLEVVPGTMITAQRFVKIFSLQADVCEARDPADQAAAAITTHPQLAEPRSSVGDAAAQSLMASQHTALAPRLQLITSPSLGSIVRVPQGTVYTGCLPGQQPLPDHPCELGATAVDGTRQRDLTYKVLVCPPPTCHDGLCEGAIARCSKHALLSFLKAHRASERSCSTVAPRPLIALQLLLSRE